MTKFKLAMPDEFKLNNPIDSYRNYYINAKKDLLQYKNREMPNWLLEGR